MGTLLRADECSHSHVQCLQSLQQEWRLLLTNRKLRATGCGYVSPATRLKQRRTTRDTGPCVLVLTGYPATGEPWVVQLTGSLKHTL